MNVHVSIILGTAPVLIASRYFLTVNKYYFPVIWLFDETSWYSFKVDFIFVLNSKLWLTNSGLSSSKSIWSKFWSFVSSIRGFTKVKQSLFGNADVIAFLIEVFCCSFVFEVKAIYRYSAGVIFLPLSSTSWRVKSLTTQINWGLFVVFSWSILFTKFKTKLKVWRAV